MKILIIFWILYGIAVHARLNNYNDKKRILKKPWLDLLVTVVMGPIGTLIFFYNITKRDESK